MKSRHPALILTLTGLVLLCINPAYTQGEHFINLLLCVVLCISPLVLLLPGTRVFLPRIDIPLALVCFFLFSGPILLYPETIRMSTMLFTCAYCVFMMMFSRILRISGMTSQTFMKVIRAIVYAFAAVLLIQQMCVIAGWPVFNLSYLHEDRPFKLNSLTAEPSHSTITLVAILFFYTQTWRITHPERGLFGFFKENALLMLCWIWVLFTTVNATAYVFAPLALVPLVTRKNIGWISGFAISVALLICFTPIGRVYQIERLKETAKATLTLDEQRMIETDGSIAFRTVPMLRGAKALLPIDRATFTGHGVDADQRDFEERPTTNDGKGFAGFFSMMYNYGLFCALSFWWAIGVTTLIPKRPLSILAFLFALLMAADYNMQLVWMIMTFGMTFKYSVCGERVFMSRADNFSIAKA